MMFSFLIQQRTLVELSAMSTRISTNRPRVPFAHVGWLWPIRGSMEEEFVKVFLCDWSKPIDAAQRHT